MLLKSALKICSIRIYSKIFSFRTSKSYQLETSCTIVALNGRVQYYLRRESLYVNLSSYGCPGRLIRIHSYRKPEDIHRRCSPLGKKSPIFVLAPQSFRLRRATSLRYSHAVVVLVSTHRFRRCYLRLLHRSSRRRRQWRGCNEDSSRDDVESSGGANAKM